ncbi:Putative bacterial surface antigen (D15), surface antigen D15 [Septoria linicola]|uniref:Bacterial surface antigen (D15), surface antigen D15 n=1 Tax=Septoria linicola TaxID=215465 RepID=A0A9Q9AUD8_9PEZI|nr:Putative bacterial surface antigen (D15), surface antigen D15 [Septoria linicola]
MATSPPGEDVFSHLRKPIDPQILAQHEADLTSRISASHTKAEARQHELLALNSTAPVTISSVKVLHATHTRRGFLERIFDPLVTANRSSKDGSKDEPYYTLQEALTEVSHAVDKLSRLDIFQPPIATYIDKAEPTDANSTPTDYAVYVTAKERGRYTIKTGTEAGTAEGSAYVNAVLRNLFGGGERLNGHASLGTRTRETYSATFDTPILSNPDLRLEVGGLKSSTIKPWASHEEVLRGGQTRLLWRNSPFTRQEFGYSGFWRQVTGLAEKASPAVRGDAGDSFKSSLSHTFTYDTRDVPMLPSRGLLFKAVSELAGVGPLGGDVAFGKYEVESQAALPIPIPGIQGDSGVSFTAGLRGGFLAPLPLGGQNGTSASRINDRFQLGGPTDVRGFRLSGLGPRDGNDAVGGDVYAAGGASLLFPLPRVGKDTPLRLQAFVNAGRLLALRDGRSGDAKDQPLSVGDVGNSLVRTINDLGSSLPSTAAGFGLVYAHPAARVEVNFSLPLIIRKGEEGRKGLSFGIGLDFL